MCFWLVLTVLILKLYIFISVTFGLIMQKPVYLMTMYEVHEEYNSLIDQISSKFEQFDSGELGPVGSLAFNPELSLNCHIYLLV